MSSLIVHNPHQGIMNFRDFDNVFKFCEHLVKSPICPITFKSRPGDALVAIQYGMEVGLAPMQALQNLAIINGKPCLYGDAMLALCKASPVFEWIKESYDTETQTAICMVKRKGEPELTETFSKQDAEEAGLWGKQGPWRQYPRRMLKFRARGFALRDAFPDVLKGIISAAEAGDYSANNAKVISINPDMQIEPPELIHLETKEHLTFLIQHLQLREEQIDNWLSKLGASTIDSLTQVMAEKQISVIIEKYPHVERAWQDLRVDRVESVEEENA